MSSEPVALYIINIDRPAIKPLKEIQEAFAKLEKPLRNDTALKDFLKAHFGKPGGELQAVPKGELKTNVTFLNDLPVVIKEFTERVVDIWPSLTRKYVGSQSNCTDCPNSFIPINRPFVVAGGRFREPYYWDSYWILEGLLRTKGSFTEIAKNTIENFLDLVEQFGMVPNGARVYYLNRSQPPMLAHMVKLYIEHTGDKSILTRALPLLVREYSFWQNNRTVEVKAGAHRYKLNRYAVDNTEPRPESFFEDYSTANDAYHVSAKGLVHMAEHNNTAAERAALYRNLASAAESGWDFSSRWLANPLDSARDRFFPLRSLASSNIVPVCLNSILYGNERVIAQFYKQMGNDKEAKEWEDRASYRSHAMHESMWNAELNSYFDYNMTTSAQNVYIRHDVDTADKERQTARPSQQVVFHVGQFYPFWMGAAPSHIKDNPVTVNNIFGRIKDLLDSKPGGIPATNYQSKQQWDQPNVWPPLMHVLMKGLLNTPAILGEQDPAYQALHSLALKLGQRYLDSTFCAWYATGGSTSKTPKLRKLKEKDVGVMFEKYSDFSTRLAGGGGEYEVVEGFGWTNGVLLWVVDTFRGRLLVPKCGGIKPAKGKSP